MGTIARWLGLADGSRSLVDDLSADFRTEMAQAALLRQLADRATYPQHAAALREMAATEERHADWLRDRLIARGEPVPGVDPVTAVGRNGWERVVDARHRAQQKRRRFVDRITRWDPDEPHVVEMYQRIEGEDQAALPVYEGLVMRTDPHAND